MIRKELRKLRKLYPTKTMMQKAGMDVPVLVERKNGWRKENLYKYKYGIYMRSQVLGGILKTAFFLAENMRLGVTSPVYELFISKETGEFITWDVRREKWRSAKVDMLDWPEYTWHSGRYINPEGYRGIKSYLGTESGGYRGILEWQQAVRKEELKERYRRETEAWDIRMDQVPALPKDWDHWVDKTAITQNYIFYEYQKKGVKEGYCTWCERTVPVVSPRHNQYGVCRRCGRKVQYKARGKAGSFETNKERAYLVQRCEDGAVVRMFYCWRTYRKPDYENPQRTYREARRAFFDDGLNSDAYYWGLYKNDHTRWIWEGCGRYGGYSQYPGVTYKRTLYSLSEKELRKTGLKELVSCAEKVDVEEYLARCRRHPEYEKLSKAGLGLLAIEDMNNYGGTLRDIRDAKDLAKALGIDKARMKRLRKNRGKYLFLEWLRYEKAADTIFPDEVIGYFSTQEIGPGELDEMRTVMAEKKICNYLKRQSRISGRRAKELIHTWEDYICIARRLGMDISKELFYKPNNLKKAHDDAVAMCGGADIAKRAGEIAGKFPDIDGICGEIREKYGYEEKKYSIVVPEKIEDIIREGQVLGHCLHSSDRYFERIHIRESYIVFLRRTEEPDKPYYTLEIEPDGTARQKRTAGDNLNADFDEAKNFIRRWQQEVQKCLTEEDEKLAGISRRLRAEEFEELREEKKKVWHGKLAGKLLADVLEADLMEVERAAAG